MASSLAIKFRGRKHALGDHGGFAIFFKPPEKTAAIAFVAHRRTGKFHANQQRIQVAIHAHFAQQQFLAAAFALGPQFPARAAVERDESGRARALQRLAIHESQHQHFAAGIVLDDRRDQAAVLRKVELHFCSLKTKNPLAG